MNVCSLFLGTIPKTSQLLVLYNQIIIIFTSPFAIEILCYANILESLLKKPFNRISQTLNMLLSHNTYNLSAHFHQRRNKWLDSTEASLTVYSYSRNIVFFFGTIQGD